MSTGSGDCFEEIESLAYWAGRYSSRAEFVTALSYIAHMRRWIDRAEKLLKTEIACKKAVLEGNYEALNSIS